MLESNMTEKEFNELADTSTVAANGWNSLNMSACRVLSNENGTPVAITFTSKDSDFDSIYHRF